MQITDMLNQYNRNIANGTVSSEWNTGNPSGDVFVFRNVCRKYF